MLEHFYIFLFFRHKPTMEIVLWKPPGGLVDQLIRSTLEEKNSDEKKNSGQLSILELGASESISSTARPSVHVQYDKLYVASIILVRVEITVLSNQCGMFYLKTLLLLLTDFIITRQ